MSGEQLTLFCERKRRGPKPHHYCDALGKSHPEGCFCTCVGCVRAARQLTGACDYPGCGLHVKDHVHCPECGETGPCEHDGERQAPDEERLAEEAA